MVGAHVDEGERPGQFEDTVDLHDVARGEIVLVGDVADHFLDEVLHRDDAGGPAEFVEHDGHLGARAPQVVEDALGGARGRDEQRLAQEAAQSEGRVALAEPEILREEDADDVVERLVVDRVARVALAPQERGDGGLVVVHVQRHDLGARAHHVVDPLGGKVENAGEHQRVGLAERADGARLQHEEADLLRGVGGGMLRHRSDPRQPQERRGGAVEHPDERRHEAREGHQRKRDQPADALRHDQRHRLGGELSKHDVQEGDDHEGGDRRRGSVGHPRGDRHPELPEEAVDDHRQRRLADPSKRE